MRLTQVALFSACLLVAACSALPAARPAVPVAATPTPAPGTTPLPPPTPPPTRYPPSLALDRVSLSDDGSSLDIVVVGGAPMADGKPCGADYAISTAFSDTTLELYVTETASRQGECLLTELVCCEHTFTTDVPDGVDRVRDMGRAAARLDLPSAGVYLLKRPPEIPDLTELPQGWSKSREQADFGGSWTQFYESPDGSGPLEFRASLDGELNSEPEYLQPPVLVNGHEAEYSLYGDTGEIAIQWMDGTTALMLLGLQSDFHIGSLVPLAESALPTPSGALTRDEAMAFARIAVGDPKADIPLLWARIEHWDDEPRHPLVSPAPEPSRLVWVINLGEQPSPTGGQGWLVVLDYETGELLSLTDWVS